VIYSLGDRKVEIRGEDYFVADNATLIGSVVLEQNASVWFNAVVRADNTPIVIGRDSNVQDGAVLHSDEGFPLTLGTGVTVGHKAVVHGCTIGDYTLVGINSTVLNGAQVGKHCMIGANAMIPEGMVIPDGSLVVGCPAKIKRTLDDDVKQVLEWSAQHYVENFKRFKRDLVRED